MSWAMINGWRHDINEGPYDYLAVRDGWEIFSLDGGEYRVTDPKGGETTFPDEQQALEFAYASGCSRPRKRS